MFSFSRRQGRKNTRFDLKTDTYNTLAGEMERRGSRRLAEDVNSLEA